MIVRITATLTLPAIYGTEDELASMSDEAVKDMVWEDLMDFAQSAKWTITREPLA